jgi:ATP-dependent DNA helicase RecG
MKRGELEFILEEGENYRIEFKERLNNSVIKEMCAFANSSGGTVLLGVDDRGKITEYTLSNQDRSRIQDMARNCQPPLSLDITIEHSIVFIHVKESDAKPVHCSEGFFLRQGANSQKLNRDQIIQIVNQEGLIKWDQHIFDDFLFEKVFNPSLLKSYLKRAGIQTSLDDREILLNLKLLKTRDGRDYLTNTGFLFFGTLPELAVTHMYITCALYKGSDKVHILDRKDFREDIVSNIDNAVLFVERNTRLRAEIVGMKKA